MNPSGTTETAVLPPARPTAASTSEAAAAANAKLRHAAILAAVLIIVGAVAGLVGTSDPLKTIANEWGFTDISHFDKTFRSHYGVAPAEYRELVRAGKRTLMAV